MVGKPLILRFLLSRGFVHIHDMWHTRATGWGKSSTIFMRLISRRILTPCSVWLKLSLREQIKMLTASSKRLALNTRKSSRFLSLVSPTNTQILRSTSYTSMFIHSTDRKSRLCCVCLCEVYRIYLVYACNVRMTVHVSH